MDGTAHKVFKYSLSGSSLGSWSIDPTDTHPTGITIDPTNVSNIWIVDNGTDKVYQYTAAATRTSGSQSAAATFTLNPYDTNPQGIADPPPAGSAVAEPTPTVAPALTDTDTAAKQVPLADLWGTPFCQTETQVGGSQFEPAADLFSNSPPKASETHGTAALSAITTLNSSAIDEAFAADLDSWLDLPASLGTLPKRPLSRKV